MITCYLGQAISRIQLDPSPRCPQLLSSVLLQFRRKAAEDLSEESVAVREHRNRVRQRTSSCQPKPFLGYSFLPLQATTILPLQLRGPALSPAWSQHDVCSFIVNRLRKGGPWEIIGPALPSFGFLSIDIKTRRQHVSPQIFAHLSTLFAGSRLYVTLSIAFSCFFSERLWRAVALCPSPKSCTPDLLNCIFPPPPR